MTQADPAAHARTSQRSGRIAEDPVFAAIERAPLVPLTDRERELLAEVEQRGATWISTEEMMDRLESLRPSDDAQG